MLRRFKKNLLVGSVKQHCELIDRLVSSLHKHEFSAKLLEIESKTTVTESRSNSNQDEIKNQVKNHTIIIPHADFGFKIDLSVLSQIEEFNKEFKALLDQDNPSKETLNKLRVMLAIVRRRLFLEKSIKAKTPYTLAVNKLLNALDQLMQLAFQPSLKIFVEGDILKTDQTITVPLLPKYFDPNKVIEYCSVKQHCELIDRLVSGLHKHKFSEKLLEIESKTTVTESRSNSNQDEIKNQVKNHTIIIPDADFGFKIDPSVLSQIEEFNKEFKALLDQDNPSKETLNKLRVMLAIVRRRLFLAKAIKAETPYTLAVNKLLNALDQLMQLAFQPSLKIFVEGDILKTDQTITVPLLPKYFDPDKVIEYCEPSVQESKKSKPALPSGSRSNQSKIDKGIQVFLNNFEFFMAAFNPNFNLYQQWIGTLSDDSKSALRQISFRLVDAIKKDFPLKSHENILLAIQSIHESLKAAVLQENNQEKIAEIMKKLPVLTEVLSDISEYSKIFNTSWSDYFIAEMKTIVKALNSNRDFYNNIFSFINENDSSEKIKEIWQKRDIIEKAIKQLNKKPIEVSSLYIQNDKLSYCNQSLLDDLHFIITDPSIQQRLNQEKRPELTCDILPEITGAEVVATEIPKEIITDGSPKEEKLISDAKTVATESSKETITNVDSPEVKLEEKPQENKKEPTISPKLIGNVLPELTVATESSKETITNDDSLKVKIKKKPKKNKKAHTINHKLLDNDSSKSFKETKNEEETQEKEHKLIRNILIVGAIASIIAAAVVLTSGFGLLSLPFLIPAVSGILASTGLAFECIRFKFTPKPKSQSLDNVDSLNRNLLPTFPDTSNHQKTNKTNKMIVSIVKPKPPQEPRRRTSESAASAGSIRQGDKMFSNKISEIPTDLNKESSILPGLRS